ncbi:20S proteasome subunit A/B [Dyella sp. A6]|uniref:20S proteasome subunit A/B n=1 Tax=Dyella aluminiiresistens TaxID=3069105 RepID=UPI002E791B00|nr:20S proteasome subunit A/B [Dyella sp. A6]
MTYCVGIQVEEGLVFASDTRTSASFDDVRVHTKMHVFDFPGECSFVLMSAGNLGTTQAVVSRLQRDLDDGAAVSLRTFRHLFEAAEYVGRALVAAQAQVSVAAQQNGVSVESTLILGGQIAGESPGLFLIYPLGNCIAASPETPYLQIGESKYGKPILDRIIRNDTTLEDASRCALVSLDSTIRSNVSVGLPIDLALLRAGELKLGERMRLDADTPLYQEIHENWSLKLEAAVRSLPHFPWERAAGLPDTPPAQAQRPATPNEEAMANQAAQQQQ